MKGKNYKSGFTIIEMSLAMTFVSILLISIVVLTLRMTDTFNRGRTIRDVTAVGRSIISDLQTTVGSSPAPSNPGNPEGRAEYFPDPVMGTIATPSGAVETEFNGRFCTGTHTYMWNTGPNYQRQVASSETLSGIIRYEGVPVRLLKIPDPGRRLCGELLEETDLRSGGNSDISSEGSELIGASDANLAIYRMSVQTVGDSSGAGNQVLYNISFVLGTMSNTVTSGGIDGSIDVSGLRCETPANSTVNTSYCAINRFDLSIRAGASASAN